MNDRELLKQAVIKKMAVGLGDIYSTLTFQDPMAKWKQLSAGVANPQAAKKLQSEIVSGGLKGAAGLGAAGLGAYGLYNMLYPHGYWGNQPGRRAILL